MDFYCKHHCVQSRKAEQDCESSYINKVPFLSSLTQWFATSIIANVGMKIS